MGRNGFRRGDGQDGPAPESGEGRDIGLSDKRLPGGQPHIANKAALAHRPVAEPQRAYYGGMMAHGVVAPVEHDGRITARADERSLYEASDTVLTEPAPDPRHLAPIPVTIVSEGSGKGFLLRAAYGHVTLPAAGSQPVRIAGRDHTRRGLYIINTHATVAAWIAAYPGDLIADITAITTVPVAGSFLPAAQSNYTAIRDQGELFGISATSTPVILSWISEYEVREP